jgi:hypothetical protein
VADLKQSGLTGYDPALLDGLPVNGFNFDQWSTWFSNIERIGPHNDTNTQPVGYPAQHQQQHQSQPHPSQPYHPPGPHGEQWQ